MSLLDAPRPQIEKAEEILGRTGDIHGMAQSLMAHPPADANALKASAQLLIGKLTALQNDVASVEAGLQMYHLETRTRLQQSPSYALLITALYLVGVFLTVLGAFSRIEIPTPAS
jgi:hypothetical protein